MRPKRLLRGAAGVLLATGAIGAATVAAVPAHATPALSCQDLEDQYDGYIANAQEWLSIGTHNAAVGLYALAADDFQESAGWYLKASNIQLC